MEQMELGTRKVQSAMGWDHTMVEADYLAVCHVVDRSHAAGLLSDISTRKGDVS